MLDGDPASPQKGAQQPLTPLFRPLLWHVRPSQQLLISCYMSSLQAIIIVVTVAFVQVGKLFDFFLADFLFLPIKE